jgi:hypothetical protein
VPYKVRIGPQAAKKLEGLEPELATIAFDGLLELLEHPIGNCRASAIPEVPGYQVVEFWCDHPFEHVLIKGFFRFDADEEHVHLMLVGIIRYSN